MRWLWPLLMIMLAGCTGAPGDVDDGLLPGDGADEAGSAPAAGFAPQEGRAEDHVGNVSLVGQFEACASGYCIDAVATNEGGSDVHVEAVCTDPWRERMEQEGQAVPHREPRATCMAFGTEPMAPGAQREAAFAWNGTTWDEEAEAYVEASGAYQWTVLFAFFDEAGDRHETQVTFTVVVGAT